MRVRFTSAPSASRNAACFACTSGLGSGITTSMRSRPCGAKLMSSTPVGFTRCFSTSITCFSTWSLLASGGSLTA